MTATEDPENETYVTNDADGKYFHDLPDDHFIVKGIWSYYELPHITHIFLNFGVTEG